MEIFNLPKSTEVNKSIPKNSFDSYINTKQKKLFSELISKILWTNKISTDTINLVSKEIKEIQVFKIILKTKQDVKVILDIIDKSIPYSIIFIIEFENMVYLSSSAKHSHPTNEDKSVIDWNFKTDWFTFAENKYTLNLVNNIDSVYNNFIVQLSDNKNFSQKSLQEIIEYNINVNKLESEISKLKSKIISCKQFNSKVDLNLELKNLEKKLKIFIDSNKYL